MDKSLKAFGGDTGVIFQRAQKLVMVSNCRFPPWFGCNWHAATCSRVSEMEAVLYGGLLLAQKARWNFLRHLKDKEEHLPTCSVQPEVG